MKEYKIKKVSSNLGTAWKMVILDMHGMEMARYKRPKSSIDNDVRRMRYALNKHLISNNGTIYNYQW